MYYVLPFSVRNKFIELKFNSKNFKFMVDSEITV